MKKNNKPMANGKWLIAILTFLFLVTSGFSANHSITSCSTFIDGDTYIIDETFIGNSCTISGNDIILTSNGVDVGKALTFYSTGGNNTIDNLVTKDISLTLAEGNYKNLIIKNSEFYNMTTPLVYITRPDGGAPSYGSGSFYYGGFSFINSTLKSYANDPFFQVINTGNPSYTRNKYVYFDYIIFDNNDILGFNNLLSGYQGGSNKLNSYLRNVSLTNNNLLFNSFNPTLSGTLFVMDSSNYLGWIDNTDANQDFTGDNLVTLSYGGHTYYNAYPQVKTNLKNNGDVAYNYFVNSPSYYNSNERIYFSGGRTLDGLSTGIDLTLVQNTIIDLTYSTGITANNVRVIKLGNNNGIVGGLGGQKSFNVGQQITTTYIDFYSTNYHLIEYTNNALVDNLNFSLNFFGTSVIRKDVIGSDGIYLTFTNNNVDLNMVPSSELQPMIVFGCKATIKGNTFDMFNIQNQSVFGDGRCNSGGTQIAGGHLIQDNIFTRGGITFRQLYQATSDGGAINLVNKFNHNSYTRLGTGVYAKPVGNFTLNIALPEINQSYYYQTTCQNHKYNIGNHYQSVVDNAGVLGLTDNNGDGIYDQSLNFSTTDVNSNPVFDKRGLTSYPYDFAGQTGTASGTTNTCGSLTFNIIKPQNEMVYPSTTTFGTNWEYISSTYSNLECNENFNGIVTLFSNVDSGVNKGIDYGVSDGVGNFQVQCCNTPECDNLKITSNPISFQIGALTSPIIIDPNPVINPNPGGGGGGTNQTNYTQTTNGTQYYDTNVIDFNSVENTNQNTASFLQNIMGFVINVGIPTGVLIVIIVSVLAILRLLV